MALICSINFFNTFEICICLYLICGEGYGGGGVELMEKLVIYIWGKGDFWVFTYQVTKKIADVEGTKLEVSCL